MNRIVWHKPLMAALAAVALCSAIEAKSSYYSSFQNRYPGTATGTNVVTGTGSSCLLCHGPGSASSNYNAYGWDLRQRMNTGMSISQALAAVESDDSDVDPTGSSNLTEIDADSQPGWTDGQNNTIYRTSGSHLFNQDPPAAILGSMDPPGPGIGYCFGDPGSGTPCPCTNDNDGSVPGSGCANGVFASGAKLTGSGIASVSNDSLVLSSTGLENNNTGLYFQANNATNGGNGNVFGDGLRCAGGGLIRLQIRTANGLGESQTSIAIATKGMVSAGDTKRYQCWYRTTSNPPCGLGVNDFNLTNGYEVIWTP